MKKILIPAILAVTVLVAASFAFMPVQRASTTHASAAGAAAGDITCTGCVGTTDIADGAAGVNTADIAPGAVTTAEILDDTVGAADVAGSDAALGPIRFQDGAGTVLTAATGAFTPAVTSQALVICAFEGAVDAAVVDGLMTLDDGTGDGTIVEPARNVDEAVAIGDFWSGNYIYIVTGITTATTFTCTLSGTGVADADTTTLHVFALWFPQ